MQVIFEYFLKNFSLFYRCDFEKIELHYGLDNKSKIQIKKALPVSFFEKKQDIDFNRVVWKEWLGKQIPFLFHASASEEILRFEKEQIIITYDIVASTFYFLSGWNEYVNFSRDELGRVVFSKSAVKKLNVIFLPVVNYYFDISLLFIFWNAFFLFVFQL
jgi:hypothetical protein